MAIIYSYPQYAPKPEDLLIGTVTLDENAAVPIYDNPTVSFTIQSLLDMIAPITGAQNLQQVTNIGATTSNTVTFTSDIKVTGRFYDSSGSSGLAGQVLSSTVTGTSWIVNSPASVTSVGLTMPAAFTVANSPITTAGVLAVTGAGTAAQYINGLGNLVTFPTIPTPYVLPLAADGTRGGIQIGYTSAGKNYAVQLSSEKAFVNVPWTDTPYTLPVATSSDLGGVKIGYTDNAKNYAVELDSDQMYVNVPWTDTPYVLPLAADGTRGGVQIGYTENAKNYPVELSSEKMFVNVPWTDTQLTQTITGTGSDNTDSGVLLSNSGGTVLILGAGSVAASQTGNTITLTGTDTDTGITGVTLAIADSTGAPLSESIAVRELTLTSSKYVGGANVGYVPEGGTSSTYLKGDGTWAAIPTGLQFKGTWDASGGGGGSPDLTDASNKGAGFLWICDVAGTAYPNGGTNQPSTWALGDWCVYDGTAWTRVPATNAGVTSIVTTDGTYIDLTPNTATTGAITVTADLSAADGSSDTNTRFLSKDNTWDVPSYTGAGVTSLTSVKGTYIDITNNSTATGAVGLGTVDLNAVDGTSDTATKFLSKDNTWDVPSYTTDTNTIYDLENSGSGNTGDISLVTGDVVATADVNGASSGNSITYDNESPTSGILDGQIVRGTGIPAGTRVVSHTATVLTLNQAANVANNAVLSFHTADTVKLVGAGATVVDKNSGNIRITSTNTQNTYTAGAGLSVSNFVFSADIDTTAASSATNNLSTDSGRYYAVQLDNNSTAADRKMVVNVPWLSGGTYTWKVKDNTGTPIVKTLASGETLQFIMASHNAPPTATLTDTSGSAPYIMTLTGRDTTYGAVSTSAAGLAPQLPATVGGKFLRADANWVVPPDEDTLYTLAGAADASVAANYDLVLSADGTAQNTMVFKQGGNITFTRAANSLTIAAANDNDQYALAGAASATAGEYDLVLSNDGTDQDTMVFKEGSNVTFTRAADSLTIAAANDNDNTTYSIDVPAATTNINLKGANPTSNDAIALTPSTGISITRNNDSQLTFANTSPDTGVPAILSNGSAPSLNTGITGAEVRTLIDAQKVGEQGYNTIIVTVVAVAGVGNRYYLDGYRQINAQIKPGFTYRFDQSDSSNSSHPLAFKDYAGNAYTTGVTTVGTPGSAGAYTQIIPTQQTNNLTYYCTSHTGMGGTVTTGTGEVFVDWTNVANPGKLTLKSNTESTLQLRSEDVALAANEIIGAIEFYGSDGTAPGAGVKSSILARNGDQVGGTGDKSNLIFAVSDGTSNNNEALRINSTGSIAIDGATKYGGSGQVLTSAGDAPPTWETPSVGNNFYLDGITKAGNVLTFSVSGTTNQTYTFGSNAFNSTTIYAEPGIFSGGGTPTLATGVTAAEVRTLIGAGTGNGDITGVTAGTDLSGGGTSGTVTLNNSSTLATVTGRGATTGTACSFTNTTSFLVGSGGVGGSGIGSIFLGNIISSTAAGNGLRFHTNNINAYIDTKLANIYFRDYADNAGSVFTRFTMNTNTGTFTATGDVVAYSDQRLKTDIKTLDGSKVYKMRGVEFIKDGKQSSGVIAQELEKVAPELVNSDSEYKSVAYGNISGYLIEAIKELKAEIQELKKCNCNKCNCSN